MLPQNSSSSVGFSKQDLSELFALPDIGMLSLDNAGRIIDVNAFISGLLLYSNLELRGRSLSDFSDSPIAANAEDAINHLQRKGHLRSTDLLLKSRDGLRFSFEFRELGHLPDNARLIECQFQELELKGLPAIGIQPAQDQHHRRIVYSRRFEELTRRELALTGSKGRPLSLLSIGIDRVSSSPSGRTSSAPLALRGFAKACAKLLRGTDIVGRINDTAFVALLPGVATNGALSAAERLRTAIAADETLVRRGHLRRITLSIGVVSTRTGRIGYDAFVARANSKRDDAREQGGNRVVA